ncbi:MAG TPA: twin-arginine translocase subunit TatC [Pyrinomonadaceae bacterium]|jgi:sec-independent protein translocase protein TatC
MSTTLNLTGGIEEDGIAQGAQMSFLSHLDELRRRIVRSVIFVFVALFGCWFVSDHIYNFLAVPIQTALAEAQRRQLPARGLAGEMPAMSLASLQDGMLCKYTFAESIKLGQSIVPPGTTVAARVAADAGGRRVLLMDEPLIVGHTMLPTGTLLPLDFAAPPDELTGLNEKLIVSTAMEPFSLYVKVSLYAAVCLALPFLLWQVWGFISPGLHPHERGYVIPFISLSSISFFIGAAFAYYVIFPPAAVYLLSLGKDFKLYLKADDYFDFIILIMLAMGIVFQMPAVTYVLSRIGLVSASFLIRSWRVSSVVIVGAAAVLSPTSDVLNMLLFAAPMVVLYVISILVAWLCAKQRITPA